MVIRGMVYNRYTHIKCNRDDPKLVGGIPTPLENMKVNWDDDIPNIWEIKKWSKPTTSQVIFVT